MKMLILRRLLALVVCGWLAWAGPARADAVVDWNEITAQAILNAPPPGPVGVLYFALVHAAVYDAVQPFSRRYHPYHTVILRASGSPVAAIAKAAHDVLLNLFPAQAAFLDTTYHTYLADQGLAETDPGVVVGQQAAASILTLRATDGRFPPNQTPFTGGTDPGQWRPTPSLLPGLPPSLAPGATPWVGDVTPFTLTDTTQFLAAPPPALTSDQYTADYNEVKALGARFNSTRTPEQTAIGYFFADNTPVLWNRALQGIATTYIEHPLESARLFALANLASADAVITAWKTKYTYVFWRPITAIQNGDTDTNPQTVGDPTWQPLINTPNYPDYTSGANNVAGAMTRTLKLFFGTDELPFSITSANPNLAAPDKTRHYERFSDAAQEVVNARIYVGIHFRTADLVARSQGRHVASWVFSHFLRPLHEDE